MDDKKAILNIRIEQELKDRFTTYCKNNAINSSELVRQLITKWLDDKNNNVSSAYQAYINNRR